MAIPDELSKAVSGDLHSETRGNSALKMFRATPTELKGGGRIGIEALKLTSQEMETLASTKAIGPSWIRSGDDCVVLFAYGADGLVALSPLAQFSAMLVESFASRRGRSKVAVTSADNWPRKSKPTGMVGLKARPRVTSTSVMLTVTGRAVRVVSWKPTRLLLPRSVSSTRSLEFSGTLSSSP